MAQFSVYRERGTDVLLLDCQADLLEDLPTRLVVPLSSDGDASRLYPRLNPVLVIDGSRYVMMTQLAAAVPVSALGAEVSRLPSDQYTIIGALDLLLTGV